MNNKLLKQAGINGKAQHRKTVESSVTTAWGVDWDETFIARDLMQNFFDANQDDVNAIRVDVQNRTRVAISAPAQYDLERLFYLGSEKTADSVGQYGEGFKVAATCLLRNQHVTPVAVSDSTAVVLRIADTPAVKDTTLYPVVYDFFDLDKPIIGTQLVLLGCKPPLVEALQTGLSHFLYDGNPLLGAHVWTDYDGRFSLRKSTSQDGYVFYRKLRRGVIEKVPLVIIINSEFKQIEKLIAHDRDRNRFDDKVMEKCYERFAHGSTYAGADVIRMILEAAKHRWEAGFPLLSKLSDRCSPSYSNLFDGYYAQSHPRTDADRFEFSKLEELWKKEGKRRLPQYFSRFGARSAEEHVKKLREKALSEAQRRDARPPTDKERACLDELRSLLDEFSPALSHHFTLEQTNYTVAKTEILLGQLKDKRQYRSRDVFFTSDMFVSDFPFAVSLYLHEHAHIFGYDGSRQFTDALTELIETVVRNREQLDAHERNWDRMVEEVRKERATSKQDANTGDDDVSHVLADMSADELRNVLSKLPVVDVKRAIRSAGDSR